jgi:hypothetical protein
MSYPSLDFVPAMAPVSSLYKTTDSSFPLLVHRLILSQLLAKVQQSPSTVPCQPKPDIFPPLRTFSSSQGAAFVGNTFRTGVYFNNHEVDSDLHSSEVRYDLQISNQGLGLPGGKPLSVPPRLKLGPQMKNGIPSSGSASSQLSPIDDVTPATLMLDNEAVRPKKRSRKSADSSKVMDERKLSEEQVVVEAALALSACKSSSVPDKQIKKFVSS